MSTEHPEHTGQCPSCPVCGSGPLYDWLVPYFCPNEECKVLHWNPDISAEENLAHPKLIDLSNLPNTKGEQ